MSEKRLVIIGAGPTGIGAVSRISELVNSGLFPPVKIVVIEKESVPGGLASTVTDGNGFSWDLGVHVSGASRYRSFLKHLQTVVPEWHFIKRNVQADMKHVIAASDSASNYVPYPVQSSIPYFPQQIKEKCLEELEKRVKNGEKKHFANFDEFSLYFFGQTLQEIFIRPYNKKVWTVDLDEMNCHWVEGRVPNVDIEALKIRSTLDKNDLAFHDKTKDNTFFRYPANCLGMGELWKRFVAKYPESWFQFDTKVVQINAENKELTIQTKGELSTIKFDWLISTMPLTILGKISNLCPNLNLKHSKVALVGIGLNLPKTKIAQNLSWAYFPRRETIFYRCTIISNFSPLLVPDPSRFWSVLCEIGVKSEETVDLEDFTDKTIDGLVECGIIDSVSQVHSTWNTILDHGYPIPTIEREKQLEKSSKIFENFQIYSRGRFGGWKYENSNQDCSFEIGCEIINKIFCQKSESIYQL